MMFKSCVALALAAASGVLAQPTAAPVTCNSPDPNYAMAVTFPTPNVSLWCVLGPVHASQCGIAAISLRFTCV